jgi:hypothetical protein
MITTQHKKIEQTQRKRQKRRIKQLCMIVPEPTCTDRHRQGYTPRKKNLTE